MPDDVAPTGRGLTAVGSMDGKVAVVSGASSGSGVGITRRFVQEGATVVMLARARQRLEEVAGEFGPSAVPIATDVGDPDSVRAAFDEVAGRFGKINVLVNHAAVYRPCAVELLDDDDITRQMATNFFGPVYASRAAVPLLRAAGGGDIVNTSSESTLHPFPMLSMYVASKAALEAFGKVLAQEVRDDDIRVTTVVQGTAAGAGGGATDYAWDPGHTAAAHALWTERGLLGEVLGSLQRTERRRHRRRARLHRDPAPRAAARHGPRAQLLTTAAFVRFAGKGLRVGQGPDEVALGPEVGVEPRVRGQEVPLVTGAEEVAARPARHAGTEREEDPVDRSRPTRRSPLTTRRRRGTRRRRPATP